MNYSTRHNHEDVLKTGKFMAEHAAIRDSLVALSTHSESGFHMHLLGFSDNQVSHIKSYKVNGEVTCLAFCSIIEQAFLILGVWVDQSACLAIYSVNDDASVAPTIVQLDLSK
jgi:hypothetical protein